MVGHDLTAMLKRLGNPSDLQQAHQSQSPAAMASVEEKRRLSPPSSSLTHSRESVSDMPHDPDPAASPHHTEPTCILERLRMRWQVEPEQAIELMIRMKKSLERRVRQAREKGRTSRVEEADRQQLARLSRISRRDNIATPGQWQFLSEEKRQAWEFVFATARENARRAAEQANPSSQRMVVEQNMQRCLTAERAAIQRSRSREWHTAATDEERDAIARHYQELRSQLPSLHRNIDGTSRIYHAHELHVLPPVQCMRWMNVHQITNDRLAGVQRVIPRWRDTVATQNVKRRQ